MRVYLDTDMIVGAYDMRDCISFAIMKSLRIKKVFSFDNHFKKQGFEILE